MVLIVSGNNNNSDSDSNSYTYIKNIFDKDIDNKVEATPQTTINAKVVHAMKKLQTSYNDDANKIAKQSTQEKDAIKNLNMKKLQTSQNDDANKIVKQGTQEKYSIKNSNSLIDLAMVANDTKPAPEEPQNIQQSLESSQ